MQSSALEAIAAVPQPKKRAAAGRKHGIAIPADEWREVSIEHQELGARYAYLLDADSLNVINGPGIGQRAVASSKHILVLENDARLLLAPGDDLLVERLPGAVRLSAATKGPAAAWLGIKQRSRPVVRTSSKVTAIFEALSSICARPVEPSPFRSHPLFRDRAPSLRIDDEAATSFPGARKHAITWYVAEDLGYLYTSAPLAFYLGAAIVPQGGPSLEVRGHSYEVPAAPAQFGRWAARLLSRTFQLDCAVRYAAVARRDLQGLDVQELLGYCPEELMLMATPERLRVYLESLDRRGHGFCTWDRAAYVDPVPGTAEIMPYLMDSISAVHPARGSPVTERDAVTLSVRAFNAERGCPWRGDDRTGDGVLLPLLQKARMHDWCSRGYPIDAAIASRDAFESSELRRPPSEPEVVVVCNAAPLRKEAETIRDLLKDVAAVEVRHDLSRSDLLHTFGEGFDLVHFAGHCERSGLACPDGFADAADLEGTPAPAFFLNSCASYAQGMKLLRKGSICGVTTLFRVLDDAALELCSGFYRMLAYGYPVTLAYLGARACSVIGKEYLLMGNGSYTIGAAPGPLVPLYKLERRGLRFSLRCSIDSPFKGLILEAGQMAMPDTGYEKEGLSLNDLEAHAGPFDGMCLYRGAIYPHVPAAVRASLQDLGKGLARPKPEKPDVIASLP